MGSGNKAEMLIAICAVITSVIALFVAWDQGRVMRAQQHGSVFPVLQADGSISNTPGTRRLGLSFANSGVGPALIESVEVMRGDTRLVSLIEYRDRLPEGYQLSWTSMVGRAVAPGDEVLAVEMVWPEGAISAEQHAAVAAEWSDLTFEVCYCSVFERCWKSYFLNNEQTERTKACQRSEVDVFEELSSAPQSLNINTPELETP